MNNKIIFRDKIKEFARKKDITISELSEYSKIPLSKIKNAIYSEAFTFETFCLICKALQLDANMIVNAEPANNNTSMIDVNNKRMLKKKISTEKHNKIKASILDIFKLNTDKSRTKLFQHIKETGVASARLTHELVNEMIEDGIIKCVYIYGDFRKKYYEIV